MTHICYWYDIYKVPYTIVEYINFILGNALKHNKAKRMSFSLILCLFKLCVFSNCVETARVVSFHIVWKSVTERNKCVYSSRLYEECQYSLGALLCINHFGRSRLVPL